MAIPKVHQSPSLRTSLSMWYLLPVHRRFPPSNFPYVRYPPPSEASEELPHDVNRKYCQALDSVCRLPEYTASGRWCQWKRMGIKDDVQRFRQIL